MGDIFSCEACEFVVIFINFSILKVSKIDCKPKCEKLNLLAWRVEEESVAITDQKSLVEIASDIINYDCHWEN